MSRDRFQDRVQYFFFLPTRKKTKRLIINSTRKNVGLIIIRERVMTSYNLISFSFLFENLNLKKNVLTVYIYKCQNSCHGRYYVKIYIKIFLFCVCVVRFFCCNNHGA
jgi:hypothetical protein